MELDRNAILQSYLEESREGLVQMEEALLHLEQDPADPESLNTVFRVVHTIKGNGSALDLRTLALFAHQVEDLLDLLRGHTLPVTPEVISLLLQCGDALRGLIPQALQGNESLSSTHRALSQQLAELTHADNQERHALGSASFAAGTHSEAGARASQTANARSLRVDMEKLDRMLTLAGEIAITQGRMKRMLHALRGAEREDLLELHQEGDRLFAELQESVMKARLVPVGPMFRQFARSVRDLAHQNKKLARLVTEGDDVELDTTVVELLKDPLLHMLRNSLDHGIEKPAKRRDAGKDPVGIIKLSARHVAGSILIGLSDDGKGFDRSRIRERALALGLINASQPASDSELFRFVFEAGFSTAAEVTAISGRGVGMDVVRRNIDALRGSIEIDSQEGVGSRISIRLPLTLAIIDGFTVGVGGQNYVIPLESVTECLAMPAGAREGDAGVISLRGEPLPFLRLREIFDAKLPATGPENIVVVSHPAGKAGLAVDTLIGEGQAVIKSMGKLFRNINGIAGSTILGDGRVALILDVAALIRAAIARQAESVPA